MYETLQKPLRELAREEPLLERARQMFTVPTLIPQTVVDSLPAADKNFLTPAFYTLSGSEYVLNGLVADLIDAEVYGILKRLPKIANGIKLVRVSVDNANNRALLEVHFFNTNFLASIEAAYNADNKSARNLFPISGGTRIRAGNAEGQVQVDSTVAPPQPAIVFPNVDRPVLRLIVKPIGDYSTYTLELHSTGIANSIFDPLFSEIRFKFRPGCFNANCAPEWETGEKPPAEPVIDYLAKDYESFRLTMIAAMIERVPGWQATSEADLDQVLLELFSAAADELSDYQDRVMNEAYLASCRKRVSLARHARLMDYHIHQGNQANTWLALEINHDVGATKQFTLGPEEETEEEAKKCKKSEKSDLIVWAGQSDIEPPANKKKPANDSAVFLSRYNPPQIVHQLLNSMSLYTWSDTIVALKAGATQADLKLYHRLYFDGADTEATDQASAKTVRDLILNKKIKYLLIQERLNPVSGQAAGRDPKKRQLLRLTGAEAKEDVITGEWFVRVRWEKADALKHDYCFTVDCPSPVGKVENITLFHGNLIQVFHGQRQVICFKDENELLSENVNAPLEFHYERTRWGTLCRLPEEVLAYRDTTPGGDVPTRSTLSVKIITEGSTPDPWDEVPSLIHSDDSNENGDHFVVETDEMKRSVIRFGNGVNGREIPEKAIICCSYQVGEGLDGNVGLDAIVNFDVGSISSPPDHLEIRRCWNPFDVTNGRAPEPAMEIIRRVPEAYRARQLRAITLQDYVNRAEEIEGVSRAAASYAWTGSWRTVRVTIDPIGTNEISVSLHREVARYLNAVRLIGEDLEIRPPKFVPLEIHVVLCAMQDFWTEDIKFVLEQEFSAGFTPDGRMGFFHPDLWTFGQPLYASQIIGRALSIQGVEHVVSINIKRWNDPTAGAEYFGNLRHNEIIEVLSDPDHLERGSIEFEVKGGRSG